MKKILSSLIISMFVVIGTDAAYEKNIVDVTNGKEIRGISTPENAGGNAYIDYTDGEFVLHVELHHLSDPLGDDFYEGWLVQRSPFKFISTGILEKKDDIYINYFSSDKDYSSYDFYVLTLEPNDGDPAPADHIVEGDAMMKKMPKMSTMQDKHDKMQDMDKKMMKKDIRDPKRQALKEVIRKKLANIDFSKINIEQLTERIEKFKANLDQKGYSEAKKEKVLELIDILLELISEMKMMQK